jgi:hypothetical protein
VPDTVPTQITRAYLQLSSESFNLGGTITANKLSPESVPQPYLGELSLDAGFSWGQSTAFTLDLRIKAGIEPSIYSIDPTPATLEGTLSYDSAAKTWGLKATLNGLYASTLAEFFDPSSSKHVMPLIESIVIDNLSIEYKYTGSDSPVGTSVGSEFTIQGDLFLGELDLGFYFHTNKDGWEFWATLNPQDKDTTMGDVLLAILGEDDDIQIPDFVSNMKIIGENKDAVRIDVSKQKATTTSDNNPVPESFQFVAQVNIGHLSLAFAQLHSSQWAADEPSKRLVKVAISGFPQLEVDVPLVGKIDQPFDEIYYLWVQDPPAVKPPPQGEPMGQIENSSVVSESRGGDIRPHFRGFLGPASRRTRRPATAAVVGAEAGVPGLTRMDIEQLNLTLQDKLIVKDNFKEKKPTDLLVAPGSHFAIIIKSSTGERSCILDYDFMKPTSRDTDKEESSHRRM